MIYTFAGGDRLLYYALNVPQHIYRKEIPLNVILSKEAIATPAKNLVVERLSKTRVTQRGYNIALNRRLHH